VPRVGLLHDDDAGVVPELPGELPPANVHGKNLRRAVLQQTISESAGGCAQVERRQSGDIQLKMAQGVFQLVAAAAHVFLVRVQGELVTGFDGVAGFVRGLGVDADLTGKNGAFGAFAAFAKAAFNQGLVEASHVEMNSNFLLCAPSGNPANHGNGGLIDRKFTICQSKN
jgi:hypothetical protein